MNKFIPYKCIHYILGEMLPIADAVNGSYIVVWWKTTPLGEFYLKPGQDLGMENKILSAIRPSLEYYGASSEATRSLTDAVKFWQGLNEIEAIPARVPVSLVICTRDRAQSLRRCLSSLRELRCLPEEVIVVDNATTDDSTRLAVSEFPNVIYVREDKPGLDIARNRGIQKASMPIVAYTDDDTVIHDLWIFHIWKTFNDPSVMAMTGLVLASELKTEAQWIFEKHWPFNRGYIDRRYDSTFFQKTLHTGPPVWEIGAGANMAFRREAFLQWGFFDERLDVGAAGCNGDSEIWYRILAGGGVIHYNPRAVVFHTHRESLSGLKRQIFSYMRGFTVAILIQHHRFGHKGNLKHLFLTLPRYYVHLVRRGFPRYRGRSITVFREMRGIFSGLIFYLKNRNTPSNIT